LIVEIVPIASLQFAKVHYYTVLFEGRTVSEFKDFQIRMRSNKIDADAVAEINKYIKNIGEIYSALPHHFRDEDAAEALPPPYHYIESDDPNDFGIRLYCIRLSSFIVILLNGDRKTALKVKDCPKCQPHFSRAQRLAKAITGAILDGSIELQEDTMEIVINEDFEIDI
jgi:hypothetical protein